MIFVNCFLLFSKYWYFYVSRCYNLNFNLNFFFPKFSKLSCASWWWLFFTVLPKAAAAAEDSSSSDAAGESRAADEIMLTAAVTGRYYKLLHLFCFYLISFFRFQQNGDMFLFSISRYLLFPYLRSHRPYEPCYRI